ncbi:hypothetical protein [Flavobacterium sp. HNIBRBA15423]|uniref:hypothetical protein n=1 Tax=Flavobacterium sp. HNIBRBA15423 TaxID=3458683 RepID=UPI0040442E60
MLGLVLIYWIGKYFYVLAEKYNQNKWLYAILGVVIYYLGQIIFGVILAIFNEFLDLGIDFDDVVINLLGIPIGGLACYGFYKILENNWKKIQLQPIENIDDIGKDIDEIGM